MPLLKTVLANLLWFITWIIVVAVPVSHIAGRSLGPNYEEPLIPCWIPNAIRASLYLLLFAGAMLIARRFYLRNTDMRGGFFGKLRLYDLLLKAKKNAAKWKAPMEAPRLLGINIVWLFCWYVESAMLLFYGASHFMGDCDDGALECHCYNLPYLAPVFIITAILGCAYVTALALACAQEKQN